MSILEKIIECDLEYLKCFCEADERQGFVRFRDELLPDMYYHNYTWVKRVEDDFALIRLIEAEIAHNRSIGRDFCLVRCHMPVDDSIRAQLSQKPEVSVSGHYVFDVSDLSGLRKRVDCDVVRVDRAEMLKDLLMLDLEHDEENYGRDFCTRRVYRRKDIYLSDEGVDSYVCYYDNRAMGSCDLFIYDGAAKIENFSVAPGEQRKGYGTTILKSLMEIALGEGVAAIYLETDEDGTAKEMYQKCGFFKVNEVTDLFFKI